MPPIEKKSVPVPLSDQLRLSLNINANLARSRAGDEYSSGHDAEAERWRTFAQKLSALSQEVPGKSEEKVGLQPRR